MKLIYHKTADNVSFVIFSEEERWKSILRESYLEKIFFTERWVKIIFNRARNDNAYIMEIEQEHVDYLYSGIGRDEILSYLATIVPPEIHI